MSEAKTIEPRPYHHGDLRRALVDAARRLLEAEGPSALSLRAVAREAGVSPAAPYHHFKDKAELLDAVAHEGWEMLQMAMTDAKAGVEGREQLTSIGIAYVCFARDNPALYRVMYDAARDKEALPMDVEDANPENGNAYCLVRDTMIEQGADPRAETHLELATVAAWCGAHGLAEMAGFKQFDHLKAELGGERPFLDAVFRHMGLFPTHAHD
ncbi:TetR/AcrR family transcriptional regulator [Phenylobacterium sp.]|uniref:TetR/AcrR family transcriptional regulator n=1 Tax=Phenylobacterium sp. TaxID=1871053 RepID=UPI0025F0EFBD|nr:TetR/AcrR family transcriptional regulator [Phenylobacterium sp.]MBX3483370.1 TetR/AcrR family transcriptional regulator [Phenylobacterium sp.]MCW5758981.1 TetR/AcrR family transcriptional regulator [Phenylobacterium sp.]